METLNSIYSQTYNFVYLRAKCIFKKEEDVQQLMKEVYTKALEEEVSGGRLYSWLGRQVYSLGCGKFRKKKVSEASCIELGKEDYYVAESVDLEVTKKVICNKIEELPDLYQATLYAFYHDHLNIKELASIMGYGTKVILYRLNYSHKYLKRALEIYAEDHGVNVCFSVEAMCMALEDWSRKNTLEQTVAFNTLGTICREIGIQMEATCEEDESAGADKHIIEHEDGYMSALCDELLSYCVKEKKALPVKKILAFGGIFALIAILVALILFCVKLSKKAKGQDVPEDSNIEQLLEEPLDEPVEEQVDESEYILPNSDTVKYAREELEELSLEDLRYARNELFARYGVYFGAEDLNKYFRSKSWYTPKMSLDEFNDKIDLNKVELANLNLILEIEEEKAE